jgi:folate-dependent phosphoribosylglycinamide formyltransferase PurN
MTVGRLPNHKITIITSGDKNGRMLANLLHEGHIPFNLLVVSYPLPKKIKLNLKSLKRLLSYILSKSSFLKKLRYSNLPAYPVKPIYAGTNNGKRLHRILKKLEPEYIIMMGGGILTDNTISLASRGVINVHPGWLPYFRGIDVIRHAILAEKCIAITAHYIDEGIDTGNIIGVWALPVTESDTIEMIYYNADKVSCFLMHELCKKIIAGENILGRVQKDKHKICKSLTTEEEQRFNAIFNKKTHVINFKKTFKFCDIEFGFYPKLS